VVGCAEITNYSPLSLEPRTVSPGFLFKNRKPHGLGKLSQFV
jgi:hypothetical protein